eukprot:3439624-Pyramimonas_sp.AAC.1
MSHLTNLLSHLTSPGRSLADVLSHLTNLTFLQHSMRMAPHEYEVEIGRKAVLDAVVSQIREEMREIRALFERKREELAKNCAEFDKHHVPSASEVPLELAGLREAAQQLLDSLPPDEAEP